MTLEGKYNDMMMMMMMMIILIMMMSNCDDKHGTVLYYRVTILQCVTLSQQHFTILLSLNSTTYYILPLKTSFL